MAAGMGANVVIMDVNLKRLRHLEEIMPLNVSTLFSEPHAVERHVCAADLVIGAVLIPGAKAPVLVQQLAGSTNKYLNAAIALPDAVLLFSSLMPGRAATANRIPA